MLKRALGRTLALMVLIATLAGCVGARSTAPQVGAVLHVVVCWLHQPGDEAARQQLVDTSLSFAEIPGVLNVRVGDMLPSDRPIVVSDFDVAVVITFEDQAALEAYLEHPLHKKATDEVLRPLAREVRVYDFTLR